MIFCGYLKSTRGVIQVHLIRTKNVFRNIIPFSRGGEINYKVFLLRERSSEVIKSLFFVVFFCFLTFFEDNSQIRFGLKFYCLCIGP